MPAFSTTEQQRLSDWWTLNFLTDTANVQREVSGVWTTPSGMGAVPCMLDDHGDPSDIDETTEAITKLVLFARNTDVRSPDRLTINTIKYRVIDTPEPSTYEILRRVVVVRFPQRGAVS